MSDRSTIKRYALRFSDDTIITCAGLAPSQPIYTPGTLTYGGRGVKCSVGVLSYLMEDGGGDPIFADINPDSSPTHTLRKHPHLTFALIETKDGSCSWLHTIRRSGLVWRHAGPTAGMERCVSVRVHFDGYRHEFSNGPDGELISLSDENSVMKDTMVCRTESTEAAIRWQVPAIDPRLFGPDGLSEGDIAASELQVDVWPIVQRIHPSQTRRLRSDPRSYRLAFNNTVRPSFAQLRMLQRAADETLQTYTVQSIGEGAEDHPVRLSVMEQGETVYLSAEVYREHFVETMQQRLQAASGFAHAPPLPCIRLASPSVAEAISFRDRLDAAVSHGRILEPIARDAVTGVDIYRNEPGAVERFLTLGRGEHWA